MDGDLREQRCFRFYQVTGKKTITLRRICSLSWLTSLLRDKLEEGLRKGSLKYNSPHVRVSAMADPGEGPGVPVPPVPPSPSYFETKLRPEGPKKKIWRPSPLSRGLDPALVRIPESGKFLLLESGILGFGIRNTALEIRNPFNDWNPESKIHSELKMMLSGKQFSRWPIT